MRLIEAAETLFIRKGLDDTSVDEISEMAGYSRGAFYSNFENKEQVLLSLIDSVVSCGGPQVPKALDDIFQQISGPERIAAVREWFSNQWRRNDFIALRMEFSRWAAKDRSMRKHLAKLWRQELETYTGSVGRYFQVTDAVPADRPEVVALILLAVAHGLGTLAIDTGPEWQQAYTEAARLVFDRMTTTQISQIG